MSKGTLQEAREAFAEWIDKMSVSYHKMISVRHVATGGCVAVLDCGHTVTCAGNCMPGNVSDPEGCWINGDATVRCEECDELDFLALRN